MRYIYIEGVKTIDPECKCKECEGKMHACPFEEEINENHDQNNCDCCDYCQGECSMDI